MTITGTILLRASSKAQAAEGLATYETQRTQCRDYATAHDIDVPDDLIFQEIGKRDQYYRRKALQEALAAIEANKCQALIVWKVDRLTDKMSVFERVLERLEAKHALLWSATETDVDIRTETGKNMLRLKVMFTIGPQRSTTADRTAENRHTYTLNGRPYASHSARYGYQWVRDPSRMKKRGDYWVYLKERLEANPETAPVVVQMYEWVDAGRTLKWIARALSGNEEGGKHKRLTPWQYAGLNGANDDGEWSESSIGKMLQFPGYMGTWYAYRTKVDPDNPDPETTVRIPSLESEWVKVEPDGPGSSPAPALVTPALWQRVQARLDRNKEYSSRNRENTIGTKEALLHTGMARCFHCKGPMSPRPRAHEYDDAEGNRQYQYQCYAARKNHPDCEGVYCAAEPLDRAVQLALYNVLRNPDIIAQLARRSQEEDHAEAEGITVITPVDEYHALKKSLDDMERELQRLTERSLLLEDDDPGLVGFKITSKAKGEAVIAKRAQVEQAKRKADKYEQVERAIGQWMDYLDAEESNIGLLGDPYSLSRPHTRRMHRWWLELLDAKVIVHPAATVRAGGPLGTLQLHLTAIDPRGTLAGSADANGAVEVPVVPVAPEPLRHGGYLPHWRRRDPDWDTFEGWSEQERTVYTEEMYAYSRRYASGTLLPSDPTTLPTPDQWLAAYRKRHPATRPNPETGLPPGPTETPCG